MIPKIKVCNPENASRCQSMIPGTFTAVFVDASNKTSNKTEIKLSESGKTYTLYAEIEIVKGVIVDGCELCVGHRPLLIRPFWPVDITTNQQFISTCMTPVIDAFTDLSGIDVFEHPEKHGFYDGTKYQIPTPFPFIRKAAITLKKNEDGYNIITSIERLKKQ